MSIRELNNEVVKNWKGREFPFPIYCKEKEPKRQVCRFKSGITIRPGMTYEDLAEELVSQMKQLMRKVGCKGTEDGPVFYSYVTTESLVAPLISNLEAGDMDSHFTAYIVGNEDLNEPMVGWLAVRGNFSGQRERKEYIMKDWSDDPHKIY